jgi:multidrug efflux pump subunit AcrA (membrane-fusion protein)
VVVGASAWLKATSASLPDLPLKVVSRPAQVEQGTATIPVRLVFAGQGNLAAGMPVQVDIDAEQHTNAVLIPARALVREGEETAVFVAMGDKAQRRPVQVGLTDGTNIEILSGVKAGDMVIVDGQAGLPDEAKITIDTGEDEDADEKPADEKPPAGAAGKEGAAKEGEK